MVIMVENHIDDRIISNTKCAGASDKGVEIYH
jgi:hypothetical protein